LTAKTPNLSPTVPAHNPDCNGCLERGLVVGALVDAVRAFVDASKEKDAKLDELIYEVRVANQIKEVQDKILVAMYGDPASEENIGLIRKTDMIYNALFIGAKTDDDPGLVQMVHRDNVRIRSVWDLFIGAKWIWATLGSVIVATFIAMFIHLVKSGDLAPAKVLQGVIGL